MNVKDPMLLVYIAAIMVNSLSVPIFMLTFNEKNTLMELIVQLVGIIKAIGNSFESPDGKVILLIVPV